MLHVVDIQGLSLINFHSLSLASLSLGWRCDGVFLWCCFGNVHFYRLCRYFFHTSPGESCSCVAYLTTPSLWWQVRLHSVGSWKISMWQGRKHRTWCLCSVSLELGKCQSWAVGPVFLAATFLLLIRSVITSCSPLQSVNPWQPEECQSP